ncbi:AAA family ATPase [Aliikangiella maris]|uniref:AAA family ATPase n=2 Tax=Aliikangiella maris TaxID=3162458 RepID=A0ABV3MLS2_9GAMM
MYLEQFSLKERPFSISPDPRFLFMSSRYREALAHLTYGVQDGGGFVLLTGEVGTGKTTVCRCLLQQLPENTCLAFVLNPKLSSLELLATICDELKVSYPENCDSLKILTDKLSEHLLDCYKKGLHVVVMIDEAQNLQTDVLEQIRLLTNLETNQKKLLQIILVGQPELQEKLAKRELRQLAQRVTARYHLQPLKLKETIAYIIHRMRIAGCNRSLFSLNSVEYLHAKTHGIPRLINTICDRALFAAAARRKARVDKPIMMQAVKEVLGEKQATIDTPQKNLPRWVKPAIAATAFLIVAAISFWLGGRGKSDNLPEQINLPVATSDDVQVTQTATDEFNNNLLERIMGAERWDYNGRLSFKNLLAFWQLEYSPLKDGDGCSYAASYGLKCHRGKGNWQDLRNFNRPALLKFNAGLQGNFWGVIKSIQGLEATIVLGDKESRLKLEEISSIWTGEYLFLWQAPEGYYGDIKMGDSGDVVAWLSQMLNRINQSDNSPQNRFGSELRLQLIEFQKQRGINADGIAGMQTILKINAELLIGIPLLVNSPQLAATQ